MNHEPPRSTPIPLEFQPALERLGGNVELLHDMARFFLEDHGPLLDKLSESLKSQNAACAERFAHSLKGLSANFDRMDLMKSCAEVEDFAQRGSLDDALAMLPQMRDQASRLAADLQEIL